MYATLAEAATTFSRVGACTAAATTGASSTATIAAVTAIETPGERKAPGAARSDFSGCRWSTQKVSAHSTAMMAR